MEFKKHIPHPLTVSVDEIGVLTIVVSGWKDGVRTESKYRSYDGGFTTDNEGIHGDFELIETNILPK